MELSEWHLWFKRVGGRELRELLLRSWDPIGVGDAPLAQDEYDGYVGRIAEQLRKGSSPTDIAAMLTSATRGMGLPPDRPRDRRVAAALVSWYQDSIARWAATDRQPTPHEMTSPRIPGGAAESPDRLVVRFQTTAKASADAHALTNVGLGRFDLIVDGAALVLAVVLLATGNVVPAVAVIVVAGLSLAGSRFHPLQRALIGIRFRSILGQMTAVTIDDEGLRFENPLGSSFVPWSSITAVRSNSETVAFFRDRVVLGYIPANAFESPPAQAKVVAFARSRVAPMP